MNQRPRCHDSVAARALTRQATRLSPQDGRLDPLSIGAVEKAMVQLTSQLAPASGENACSQSGVAVSVRVHWKRTLSTIS